MSKRYRDMTPEEKVAHLAEKVARLDEKQKRHETRLAKELEDRELDIRIAKEIFGYEEVKHQYVMTDCDITETWEDVLQMREDFDDGSELWLNLPYYSTKIEDAFFVLENLDYEFQLSNGWPTPNTFECHLENEDLHVSHITQRASTLPIAICKAALCTLIDMEDHDLP